MNPPTIHDETMTDDRVVVLCSSPTRELIYGEYGSNRVVKISDQAVVKFGVGVKEEEAKNQIEAYNLLDRDIVCIPRIYRFFSRGLFGYIVMEYIKGRHLEHLESSDIHKISHVVAYFATIRESTVGPLGGGPPRGLLWPENEDLSLGTLRDVEQYFNSRLRRSDKKLAFAHSDAVLCHLDIALRNILFLADGSICLLDWQSAGFYPRLFEVCELRIMLGKEGNFSKLLLDHMERLSDIEEEQASVMLQAWHNQQMYHL
ncbi:hypothetical protein MMC27_007010 [Xylographa pallens]|nr:hypothetical protein [Xylographa pallens]